MVSDEIIGKWLQDLGDNFGVRGDMLNAKTGLFVREFGAVKDKIWEIACNNILQGEERFPTISRMKVAISDASRFATDERMVTHCDSCGGEGLLSVVKQSGIVKGLPNWTNYVFRCLCANGAFNSNQILPWHESYRSKGYVLKTEFDGLGLFEMEAGGYVAPHEEQKERMTLLLRIKKLIADGKGEEARDLLCQLDQRIDDFRVNNLVDTVDK